jgi:hypothetical protein
LHRYPQQKHGRDLPLCFFSNWSGIYREDSVRIASQGQSDKGKCATAHGEPPSLIRLGKNELAIKHF